MARDLISIIFPCHNEQDNLVPLCSKIIQVFPKTYNYEIILVDDGSSDTTANTITKLARKNKKIKGVFFYKSFGHQMALLAGLTKSRGKAIIMMDADFQHPPTQIPK